MADSLRSQVDQLIALMLPDSADDARRMRVRGHLIRVIGSVLGSTRVGAGSEPAIVESIKKSLLRGGAMLPLGTNSASNLDKKAMRYQELVARMQRSNVIQNRWSVLHLFKQLMGSGSNLGKAPVGALRGIGASGDSAHISVHSLGNHAPRSEATRSSEPSENSKTSAVVDRMIYGSASMPESAKSTNSAAERRRRQLVEPTRFVLEENLGEELSEQALLRDVIYAFQGIDGKYVRWSRRANGYLVDSRSGVPQAVRTLIGKLCEMGWLFRRVREYILLATNFDQSGRNHVEHGLVGQSLSFALQEELNDYYRLVAILEAQIQQQQEIADSQNETSSPTPKSMSALTLRRLFVWSQEPLQRLRLMASIVDSTKGLRGAALASAVDGFSRHGDPSVQQFVQRLMRELCAPLYAMLRRWLFEGELQDPHEEFFVKLGKLDTAEQDRRIVFRDEKAVASSAGTLMWHRKYVLRESMLPSWWITTHPDMASRILLIGKSLNFIRQTCKDSEWMLDVSDVSTSIDSDVAPEPSSLAGSGQELEYGSNDMLMRTVDRALSATNARLLELIFKKYKLVTHLSAIKRYLLLGQGDFAQHLMDALQPELSKRASRLFRHALLAHVDGAIRSSNAQFDTPEVLERIDVKILRASPGDDGWKVFTLDYRIGGALDAILSESAMANYLQIFRFLWRIKRVENSLSSLWQRTANTSHVLLRSVPEVRGILHKCALLRNEMQHVTSIFLSYMMYEVLETGWLLLQSNLAKATSLGESKIFSLNVFDSLLGHYFFQNLFIFRRFLNITKPSRFPAKFMLIHPPDDLIAAHESYQRDILSAALLDKPTLEIRRQLHVIFDRLLRFCDSQKRVLDIALELSHEKTVRQQQIYERSQAGRWGLEAGEHDDESTKSDLSERASALSDQVEASFKVMHKDFRSDMIRLSSLLQQSQNNQGSSRNHRNLRFLAVRMDFNHFYEKVAKEEIEEKNRVSREEEMLRGGVDDTGALSVATGFDTSRIMGSTLRASELQTSATPPSTNRRAWGEGPPLSGASSWAGSPLVPFNDDDDDDDNMRNND